jgi:hypothetical protein
MSILSRSDPRFEDLVAISYIYKSHGKSYVKGGGFSPGTERELRFNLSDWGFMLYLSSLSQDFYVNISADNKVYGQFVLLFMCKSFSFSSTGICYATIGYMYAFFVLRGLQCRVCCSLCHILIRVFNSYLERVL